MLCSDKNGNIDHCKNYLRLFFENNRNIVQSSTIVWGQESDIYFNSYGGKSDSLFDKDTSSKLNVGVRYIPSYSKFGLDIWGNGSVDYVTSRLDELLGLLNRVFNGFSWTLVQLQPDYHYAMIPTSIYNSKDVMNGLRMIKNDDGKITPIAYGYVDFMTAWSLYVIARLKNEFQPIFKATFEEYEEILKRANDIVTTADIEWCIAHGMVDYVTKLDNLSDQVDRDKFWQHMSHITKHKPSIVRVAEDDITDDEGED